VSNWLKVALTMRRSDARGYAEERDAIAHDWIAFLHTHRLLPILIPSAHPDPVALFEAAGAAALVLTGGEDVGAGARAPENPQRDALERRLLDYTASRRRPVIGVCRGLQLINVHFGGTLQEEQTADAHVNRTHPVLLEGLLAAAVGRSQIEVNSFHRWDVLQSGLGRDLQPLARAADGVIEALQHAQLPMLAVQWHPERPGSSAAADGFVFGAWLRERVS
jgi:putative glutamine amidotransferase